MQKKAIMKKEDRLYGIASICFFFGVLAVLLLPSPYYIVVALPLLLAGLYCGYRMKRLPRIKRGE